jgi:hypothetical protein
MFNASMVNGGGFSYLPAAKNAPNRDSAYKSAILKIR